MKIDKVLVGTLALIVITSAFPAVFAGNSIPPPVVPECGDMYGSAGNKGTDPGSIFLVSQADGSQTFLGDPTANGGITGIAFDDQARLWGSNAFGKVESSNLLQINPDDGSLINDVGPIQLPGNVGKKISDLAWDPVSKQLFGTAAFSGVNELVTIDTTTGAATLIKAFTIDTAHIGFATDGTLYMVDRGSDIGGVLDLFTIDPTNANVLTQVDRSEDIELDALGVRADGTIFVAGTPFSGDGRDVWTIATDGTMTSIGNGVRQVADLDFLPCPVQVGGELLPIDSTALLLAGLQSSAIWMLPVLAGVAGSAFGVLYIKSRRN